MSVGKTRKRRRTDYLFEHRLRLAEFSRPLVPRFRRRAHRRDYGIARDFFVRDVMLRFESPFVYDAS